MKRVSRVPIPDAARQRLHAMFEADRSMDADEWYKKFPPYRGDADVGAPLNWPPLSEVWRRQDDIPDDGAPCLQRWGEAQALLQRLHDEYKQAKNKNK